MASLKFRHYATESALIGEGTIQSALNALDVGTIVFIDDTQRQYIITGKKDNVVTYQIYYGKAAIVGVSGSGATRTLTWSDGSETTVTINDVAHATSADTAKSVAWNNVIGKPTNFVTTDDTQTITGAKTFNNNTTFKNETDVESLTADSLLVTGLARFTNNIQGDLIGNVTGYLNGDISGSSTSCSGNSLTATKLTNLSSSDVASSSATWRKVWFSWNDGVTGRPALSDNIAYQTSTNTLKVPNITLSGNATVNGSTTTNSITTEDLIVTGAARFVSGLTGDLAGTAVNSTQLGGVAAASYLLSSTAANTYLPKSGGEITGSIIHRGSGDYTPFVRNFTNGGTTGWARSICAIQVDGKTKWVLGAYGSYNAGADDNGIYYAYMGCGGCGSDYNIRFYPDNKVAIGSNQIYHAGNLTKATLGLGSVDNTADKDKSVKYATSAGSCSGTATRATNDSNGNNIVNTYATKLENSVHNDNLVINGDLRKGSNVGFESNLVYDGSDCYNGSYGCLKHTGRFTGGSSQLIPVNTNQKYLISVDAKSSDATTNQYIYYDCYDIDKKYINSSMVIHLGTYTTLARDLNNGDTKVYLTSMSEWKIPANDDGYKNIQGLIFWNYVDSYGRAYDYNTYSRNVWTGLYTISGTDVANNTITLKTAWNHGTFKAGTKVSQSNSTGHQYFVSNKLIPTTWTNYKTIINGYNENSWSSTKFCHGTAYISLSALWNYSGTNKDTTTLKITNWTLKVLDNEYALKDGTNALGTWGISISGNASTATNLNGGTVSATTGSFSSTLKVAGGAIFDTGINLTEAKYIQFRPNSPSYYTTLRYDTAGNEALILGMKNAVTSFMIKCGDSGTTATTTTAFNSMTPSIQVKKQSLYVNSLIADGVTPGYNFYVNGTSYLNGDVSGSANITAGGYIKGETVKISSGCTLEYSSTDKCVKFVFA